MLNGSSGERARALRARSHGSGKPECVGINPPFVYALVGEQKSMACLHDFNARPCSNFYLNAYIFPWVIKAGKAQYQRPYIPSEGIYM